MRPLTATFLAWVLIAAAQPPAPQPPQQTAAPASKTVKFSTSTQLVVEDLIIKDKSGNPMTGLKADDFIVSEDGKPQKIGFVEFQKLEQTAAPLPPQPEGPKVLQERVEPAVKSATAIQIAPEKPGDIKYRDRRLMVMFFDMTSMPISDQLRAQTAADKFMRTQMTPSDLMAIMTFSSDIKVVEDFTDDRDALLSDIKKLTIGEGQGFDETRSATTAPPIPAPPSARTIPSSTSSIPTASWPRSKPRCRCWAR